MDRRYSSPAHEKMGVRLNTTADDDGRLAKLYVRRKDRRGAVTWVLVVTGRGADDLHAVRDMYAVLQRLREVVMSCGVAVSQMDMEMNASRKRGENGVQ